MHQGSGHTHISSRTGTCINTEEAIPYWSDEPGEEKESGRTDV